MSISPVSSELLDELAIGYDGVLTKWADVLSVPREALSDAIAAHLAVNFDTGSMTFNEADHLANALFIAWLSEGLDHPMPGLSWSVYTAFDSGEWSPESDGAADPVLKYTVPEIRRIVSGLGDR